jgi:hypothetical protein
VARGGALADLWPGALLAFAAAVVAVVWRPEPGQDPPPPALAPETSWRPPGPRWAPWALLALPVAAWLAHLLGAGFVPFWLLSAVSLGAVVWALFREALPVPQSPAPLSRTELAVLGLAALAAALVTAVAHRPDLDDGFYVNAAVWAADHPASPLFAGDTLHGIDGLPILMPTFRVHAFELLGAGVSALFGAPAIEVFHLWLPPLAAVCAVLAQARLLRVLLPALWPWALVAALVLLATAADTRFSYGNFGFVRLQHGKAILLSAGVPFLFAVALEFARRPSPRRWVGLCAAQIAAVGLSSTALWLAPVVAGLGLLVAAPWSVRGLGRMVVGGLASLYVLGTALVIRAQTLATPSPVEAMYAEPSGVERARSTVSMILGDGGFAALALAVVLLAWRAAPNALARRFASVVPLVFWVVFLNPAWAEWLAANATGQSTYWRIFWLLPLPALFGIAAAAPGQLRWLRSRPALAGALGAGALVAALVVLPRTQVLSPANGVRLGRPGLKVPVEYELARRLDARLEPGAPVIAPPAVSAWLPTLHHPVQPLMVRSDYLGRYLRELGPAEVRRRLALSQYMDSGRRAGARRLAEGIEAYAIQGLCVRDRVAAGASEVLRAAGFERVETVGHWEIWIRPRSVPQAAPATPRSPAP